MTEIPSARSSGQGSEERKIKENRRVGKRQQGLKYGGLRTEAKPNARAAFLQELRRKMKEPPRGATGKARTKEPSLGDKSQRIDAAVRPRLTVRPKKETSDGRVQN